MSRRRKRKGFVLLFAVALIALAAVALAGVARHSLLQASAALRAEEDLKQRWETLSCKRAVLARAPELLDSLDRGKASDDPATDLPPSSIALVARLNDTEYELVLADEEAKISLNTVHSVGGREAVDALLRRLHARDEMVVFLRPYRYASPAADGPAFDSWGQIFDLTASASLSSAPTALRPSTTAVTCWGAGTLNLACAPDTAVAEVAKQALSSPTIHRLIQNRPAFLRAWKQRKQNEAPGSEAPEAARNTRPTRRSETNSKEAAARREQPSWLNDFLDSLALRDTERKVLERIFSDRSDCYSLWIMRRTEKRSTCSLCIASWTGPNQIELRDFLW